MSNLMDYMDWRGDVTFAGSPFSEVDNIILSMTSFVDFSGIVPPELNSKPGGFSAAMKKYARVSRERDYLGGAPKCDIAGRLSASATETSGVRVNQVDEAELMQFAASTFIPPDDVYVARGQTIPLSAGRRYKTGL